MGLFLKDINLKGKTALITGATKDQRNRSGNC